MHEMIVQAISAKRNLLEPEAMQLFADYRLPVPKSALAKTSEDAVKQAQKIGYPVVLKVVSPDVLHKSDVGGVKVGLNSENEVAEAFNQMMDSVHEKAEGAMIVGVLVVAQAVKGIECIIGMTRDPQFGPVIMFGLGGIFVEVFKDVAFRMIPLTCEDAESMIKETKGYQLLQGIRGEKPKDIQAIVELILNVAKLVEENPEIQEIDINPLCVCENGLQVLDARVII